MTGINPQASGIARSPAGQFPRQARQIRQWRKTLAQDIHRNAPGFSPADVDLTAQRFLTRLVFLRFCPGSDSARFGSAGALPAGLMRADAFYGAGLARILDCVSEHALRAIAAELHHPDFSVGWGGTDALNEIYEQSVRESVTIDAEGAALTAARPGVREKGGVVPTPRYVADAIVQRALTPRIVGKSPADLDTFTVADICCGSGVFLLSVFELLANHYLAWHQTHGSDGRPDGLLLGETAPGQRRLAFEEKRRILLAHVRGVDIDPNAVETARLILSLKLLEGETRVALRDYADRTGRPVLPDLSGALCVGNSLISPAMLTAASGTGRLPENALPFSFARAFPAEHARGGFDAIVGNPPYIRIQNLRAHSPAEAAFFASPASPYQTARQDNFDAYALFIERGISLVRPDGRLGFIVPHKFMTTRAGRALRHLVTAHPALEEIVHFGALQVFEQQAATYTCIMILDRLGQSEVLVERVADLKSWRNETPGSRAVVPARSLTADPWRFADASAQALFDRVRARCGRELSHAAEVFVGVQTSADPVYIFQSVAETPATVALRWDNQDWPIERAILRPCLHDAKLSPYTRAKPNAWMIFPYETSHGARAKARLIPPAEMARRFPLCLAYLAARRAELDRRAVSGGQAAEQQFYQFGRSQSLTKFDSPKIILPVLSLEASYAYDGANIIMTGGGNGPYGLIRPLGGAPETIFFLLAVLHHPLCEAMVRTHTSAFRGGYYSHGKQFIKGLPIPPATPRQRAEIETLVSEILNTADDSARATLRDAIEARVSALFGLSAADVDLARAVPPPA